MWISYLYLTIAVCGDVWATASLKASSGFTQLVPTISALLGYAVVFIMLSLTLARLPLGVTYAVWGGLGTIGAALVGVLMFRESYDMPRILGTALIIVGTVIMYAIPKSH